MTVHIPLLPSPLSTACFSSLVRKVMRMAETTTRTLALVPLVTLHIHLRPPLALLLPTTTLVLNLVVQTCYQVNEIEWATAVEAFPDEVSQLR